LSGPYLKRQGTVPTDISAKFLRFHQKYRHISPLVIQAMAKSGILSKTLLHVQYQYTQPVSMAKQQRSHEKLRPG